MVLSKPMSAQVTSKGQITIPKMIREKLELEEGDRVVFVEDEEGRMVVEKAALVAFESFVKTIDEEANRKGISENEILQGLNEVREELWDERKKE